MSVQEGMHNLPKLYGSEVRPQGPVTGVKSGFKEAGKVKLILPEALSLTLRKKGFFYGYLDGITGLVSEPLEGAKKEVRICPLYSHSQITSHPGFYRRR